MKIRVYYEDTDCGNVVYYANYLKYMERSRTELLREKGINLSEYRMKGVQFVVVEAHLRYRAPARYDDLLDVVSAVKETNAFALTISSTVCNDQGVRLVTGDVKLACINAQGKAMRIPPEILSALGVAA